MQPQIYSDILQRQELHKDVDEIELEQNTQSQLQHTETSAVSGTASLDLIQAAGNVLLKVGAETNNLTRKVVEKKLQYVKNIYELGGLFQLDEIDKTRMLGIQMENEDLSQEMETVLRSRDDLFSKVKNTLEISSLLQQYCKELIFKAEQGEKLKKEHSLNGTLLLKDLKAVSKHIKALIVEHENIMEALKNTVEQERQQGIVEINSANCNYQRLDTILGEETLILKSEEESNSLLINEIQKLDGNMKEVQLMYKKELEDTNASFYSLVSTNEAGEAEINSYRHNIKEYQHSLQDTQCKRDCYKKEAVELEEMLKKMNDEKNTVTQELDIEKEKLSSYEKANDEKSIQLEASEAQKLDLLKQISEVENKLQDVSGMMEDCKTKDHSLTEDLKELNSNVERIQSEYQELDMKYHLEVSDLELKLKNMKTDVDSNSIKMKEQKTLTKSLQEEFERTDTFVCNLKSGIHSLKNNEANELGKVEDLKTSVIRKKKETEEVNKSLIVKKDEVVKIQEELERKTKEHTDRRNEMSIMIDKIKQETKVVKEKQERMESECNRKRQDLMKYLDECRNDSIKQANEKEAELAVRRKDNYNLKEKLKNINNGKESIERNEDMQIKMLESKVKQLNMELENEETHSTVWSKSQILSGYVTSIQDTSSKQTFLKPPASSNPYSQPYNRGTLDDRTDSDHSSIDLCEVFHRYGSMVEDSWSESPTSVKRRRLEINYQDPMAQTKKRKNVYPMAIYRKQHAQTGSSESDRSELLEPLDLLSIL